MVNSFFLSSRSNHLPPQASSSSFSSHGQIIYLPQAPISAIRTTRIKTHQHHKNQNPQARTLSTHKHWSPLPAPIHKHQNPFPSTHKHLSLPPTSIHKHLDPFPSTHELWSSATITDPPIHKRPTPTPICLFVGLSTWCVCVSLCWFVYVCCVCVYVWVCLCSCVSEAKEDEERS